MVNLYAYCIFVGNLERQLMALRSSREAYGSMAIGLHWASALAVFLMLASGLVLAQGQPQPLVLLGHATGGVIVLILTVFRIGWWLLVDRYPATPPAIGRAHALATRLAHILFYVILVAMVVTGLGLVLSSDALSRLASGAALPDFSPEGITAHGLASKVIMLLLVFHIAGALYHQVIRRDNLLRRMLP